MLYDKIEFNRQPLFFDFLSKMNQNKIVDQFTRAAQQGIKELSVDSSGNTIVHEIIHLHSDQLFRIVFNQSCPFLNIPNSEGSTPLLDAVAANDETLVLELLKGDIAESINFANNKGITPFLAAVNEGNLKLVELLLKHGAAASINQLDNRNMSSLHIAATLKDSRIFQTLLKNGGIESLTIKDFRGFTPFQRAIISGRLPAVKMILELKPELFESVNQPDSLGVTDLQRAVRSENVEIVALLSSGLKREKIKANDNAFITEEDVESCLAVHSKDFLAAIPIGDVFFPLTIAQNYCSVMVRLKDDKILKIPNADASIVRKVILEKKYGPGIIDHEGLNILTLYMNMPHGYLRLECENCDEGKPYNKNIGYFPTFRAINVKKPTNTTPEKKEEEASTNFFYENRGLVLKAGLVALIVLKIQNNQGYPTGSTALMSAGLLPLSLAADMIKNAGSTVLYVSNQIKGVLTTLTQGAYTGLFKRRAVQRIREDGEHTHNKLLFFYKEHAGGVANEDVYEAESDLNNGLKIVFYLNNTQAKTTLKYLKKVSDSCENNPAELCRVQLIGHNCIDFMQDVFRSSGGEGDFASYFTDKQLSHGNGINPVKVYAYKAHNYAFVRSRGMAHYLNNSFGYGETMNKVYNLFAPSLDWEKDYFIKSFSTSIIEYTEQKSENVKNRSLTIPKAKFLGPRNTINLQESNWTSPPLLKENGETRESQDMRAISTPPYDLYLADQMMLGAVLIKTFVNTYHFASDLWRKIVGEKVVAEAYPKWIEENNERLNQSLDKLESIAEKIDQDLIEIDEQINSIKGGKDALDMSVEDKLTLNLLSEERGKLSRLWNMYVDLQFEGFNIEKELKYLKRSGCLATKTHAVNLENRLSKLASQSDVLENQLAETTSDAS